MRIGLLSDTHNDYSRIRTALGHFRGGQIHTLLHAGDVTTLGALRLMAGFDLWLARGNMDRDPQLPAEVQTHFGPGRLASLHILTLDGRRVALTHGDSWQQLESLVHSGDYAYVFHGHTHVPQDERIGHTRVINPGAVGNHRWRSPTCAILDLQTEDLTLIEL